MIFHEWSKYYPIEPQLSKYPNYINMCALKLNDIYRSFAAAKAMIDFIKEENYGDLANDEKSKLWFRTNIMQLGLFKINCSMDYLWMLLWIYAQNKKRY